MKRACALLFALLVLFSVSGCAGEKYPTTEILSDGSFTAGTETFSKTEDVTGTETKDDFSLSPDEIAVIEETVSGFGKGVSVAYCDVLSDYTYFYNADKKYFAASVIKAPFCLYVSKLIDEGKASSETKMKYTSNYKMGGTGKLKNKPFGDEYTVGELISYAIRYSDNSAFKMLRTLFPPDGFKAFAEKIGISDVDGIGKVNDSSLTAKDALIYFKELYKYFGTDSPNAAKLREDMLNTSNKMIVSGYPVVRKYGWATKSFHDCAIIEAERPFILIILTDHEDGTASDFAMFRKISETVGEFSQIEKNS